MKILIVNTYYAPDIYGGVEYSIKKLAEQLTQMGHTVKILCTSNRKIQETIDGVDVLRLRMNSINRTSKDSVVPKWKRLLSHLIGIWNIGNEKILDEAIKEFQPDVINTNNLYGISPIIWRVAKKNQIRLVHTIRDYHLLCPLVALSCKYTSMKACTKPKTSCKFHRFCNKLHSSYVDCVTAPSAVALNTLADVGFFPNAEQIVIPNATNFNMEDVSKILEMRMAQTRNEIRFVYLGTLSEQKGIRWMLRAFSCIDDQNVRLFIAGKGDLQEVVEEACMRDTRIQFEGFLNEEAVADLLKCSDVLLCPSHVAETFGRVVLDAYKHAMPVISSNMGALPTLVKDGVTGYVVNADDTEALADRMRRYVNDPALLKKQMPMAVEELSQYTLVEQAKRFFSVYVQ